jgi:hypothetical protein
LRALETWHGIETPDCFRVLPTAPHLLDVDHRDALLRLVADLPEPPKLIIVDTLARVLSGGDENSAKDMGAAIDVAAALQLLTGATVIFIHHFNKSGHVRGSSAFEGAADTAIRTRRDGDILTLECTKQKDWQEFDPIHLARRVVTLDDADDADGSSLVFVSTTAPSDGEHVERIAQLFRTHFGRDEVSTAVWRNVCTEHGIPEATFYRSVKRLIELGRFTRTGNGRTARYHPTDGPQGGIGGAQTVNTQLTLDRSDR